jgi:hypothetical protein
MSRAAQCTRRASTAIPPGAAPLRAEIGATVSKAEPAVPDSGFRHARAAAPLIAAPPQQWSRNPHAAQVSADPSAIARLTTALLVPRHHCCQAASRRSGFLPLHDEEPRCAYVVSRPRGRGICRGSRFIDLLPKSPWSPMSAIHAAADSSQPLLMCSTAFDGIRPYVAVSAAPDRT